MENKATSFSASEELVEFTNNYTQLIGKQLAAARNLMETTVDQVMIAINEISEAATTKRGEADQILVKTYLDPDNETSAAVGDIQESADAVFYKAQIQSIEQREEEELQSLQKEAGESVVSRQADILEARLRRLGGKFSKHMEALSLLDEELRGKLLNMMGALSSDDVVGQQLQHIDTAVRNMNVALTYILENYEERCNHDVIREIRARLLTHTFDSYTTEEERQLFRGIFGDVEAYKVSMKNAS